MERIIEIPHLPKGEVRCVIIGKKYENKLNYTLKSHNISIICADNNDFVDERISGHIDLSMLHIGGNRIVAEKYLYNSEIINKIKPLGYEVLYTENPDDSLYPNDVRLNVCILGDFVICNPRTADLNLFDSKKIIACKQGYTKCSVAVVDEHSIITSDKLIAENSAMYGIEALLIDDSFVRLKGFDKGFIGGAAFKISRDKLAFTGTIDDAEIKNAIEHFLIMRGVEAVYLTEEPIFDIGGAIPIIEEIRHQTIKKPF